MKLAVSLILVVAILAAVAQAHFRQNRCRSKRAMDYPEIINTIGGFELGMNKMLFNAKILNQTDAEFGAVVDALLAEYTTLDINFVFPVANANLTGQTAFKFAFIQSRTGSPLVNYTNANWGDRQTGGKTIVDCVERESNTYTVKTGDVAFARTPLSGAQLTLLIGMKTYTVERDSDDDDFLISFAKFDVIGPIGPAGTFLAHP